MQYAIGLVSLKNRDECRDFSTSEILLWHLSHNIFRTIAYTKKKWLPSNFLQEYFEDINVIITSSP
jgi:hypothetical protein